MDHNASTPPLREVVGAIASATSDGFANPSAGHVYGKRARAIVEAARGRVAALLSASADEIVFTSGATESTNLALRGFALLAGVPWLTVVTSTLEHHATNEPVKVLERAGARVLRLEAGAGGAIDLPRAERALAALEPPALCTLILAQNETGVIQPVRELAALARSRGAVVHVDAAQAAGKIPVSVDELGCDLLSLAGHKLYGPKGVGALYVRRGTKLGPLLVGAGQERGLRPGTENVGGIAGLGVACELAARDLEREGARQRALRDELERALGAEGYVVHGGGSARLPNTSSGRFPGVRGGALLEACPEVAFTTGSACHDGHALPSAALTAMGIAADDALGAIRLSLGRGTDGEAVERAAGHLLAAVRRLRA